MPNKKHKKLVCFNDLVADEIEECNKMLDDGILDILDRNQHHDINEEWAQALKDLKELGFMEDDK